MSLSRDFGFFLAKLMAAFGIVAVLFTATTASAQNRQAFCERYSRDAVRDNEVNEKRRCGFSGPRWSDKQAAHFGWCMIFPKIAEKESEAREAQLKDCRADRRDDRRAERIGKRANCDTYAKIAEVQADANKKYECGFRGGEWITDSRPHFTWCMRNKRDYMLDEIRYRAVELQKCFNKLGDYDEDDDKNYRRRRF